VNRIRLLTCHVDDAANPDRMIELAAFDLPQPDDAVSRMREFPMSWALRTLPLNRAWDQHVASVLTLAA
jgi:hypothetical protein